MLKQKEIIFKPFKDFPNKVLMKIFFLRHTSLNVEPDLFYGQTDLDVSSSFEEEVKVIKKKRLMKQLRKTEK